LLEWHLLLNGAFWMPSVPPSSVRSSRNLVWKILLLRADSERAAAFCCWRAPTRWRRGSGSLILRIRMASPWLDSAVWLLCSLLLAVVDTAATAAAGGKRWLLLEVKRVHWRINRCSAVRESSWTVASLSRRRTHLCLIFHRYYVDFVGGKSTID
jgi:hypothetical protein